MKTRLTRLAQRMGFTLTELLIVMAIITILAGLLFPVLSVVKENGRKAKAKIEVKQIEGAVKQYYTEYGKYPHGNGNAADWSYGNPNPATCPGNACNRELMNVLRSIDAIGNLGYSNNPRRIVFLDVSPKNLDSDGNWIDPWGRTNGQYRIAVDVSYDNVSNDTTTGGYGMISNKTVIVYSCGKDGNPNTSDDIRSWEQ